MFENIGSFFKKIMKTDQKELLVEATSKDAAKERLHIVLMQDRANVSADFLELMKQEIIDVIKKYIVIDEEQIDVRLTNQEKEDGTTGAPSLYANIPILNIRNDIKGEVLNSGQIFGQIKMEDNIEEPEVNDRENKIYDEKKVSKEIIDKEVEEPKEVYVTENNIEDSTDDYEEEDDDDDITFDDLLKAAEEEEKKNAVKENIVENYNSNEKKENQEIENASKDAEIEKIQEENVELEDEEILKEEENEVSEQESEKTVEQEAEQEDNESKDLNNKFKVTRNNTHKNVKSGKKSSSKKKKSSRK